VPQRIRSRWSCAGCREKCQKSRAAKLGATLSPGTCDGADDHRAMSALWPASGIDMRFSSPAVQSAGLQVTFGRQQFHCSAALSLRTGGSGICSPVLSVQRAAKLSKCTRDTETCMCARAWRMSFSCYVFRVRGVCHSFGQVDASSRAEAWHMWPHQACSRHGGTALVRSICLSECEFESESAESQPC
jgi:hypothetical protein